MNVWRRFQALIDARPVSVEAKKMLSATDEVSKAMGKAMFGALEGAIHTFSKVNFTVHLKPQDCPAVGVAIYKHTKP